MRQGKGLLTLILALDLALRMWSQDPMMTSKASAAFLATRRVPAEESCAAEVSSNWAISVESVAPPSFPLITNAFVTYIFTIGHNTARRSLNSNNTTQHNTTQEGRYEYTQDRVDRASMRCWVSALWSFTVLRRDGMVSFKNSAKTS